MATVLGGSFACNLTNAISCKIPSMAARFSAYDISVRPRLNLSLHSRQLPSVAAILRKSMIMDQAIQSARIAGVAFATAVADKSIHDFNVKDIDGKEVPLGNYKGKVLLAVNVASRCGLTNSNYTELSHLYEKYKTQGFEILAFPCNQFGAQEPGKNEEIKEFACTRFKAEFPIFDKVEVNGPNAAPVYKFLKSSKGGLLGDIIKWNFEKFLIDRDGKVVERYAPTTSPFQIEKDIQKLLAA